MSNLDLQTDHLKLFLLEQEKFEFDLIEDDPLEEYVPRNVCLSSQFRGSAVTEARRTVVLNWLIHVAQVYKMNDTVWMAAAAHYDNILKTLEINYTRDLHNFALTCLYISNKFEDNISLDKAKFCNMSENGFGPQELNNQEMTVLSTLKFNLKITNPLDYIRLIGSLGDCSTKEGISFHFNNLLLFVIFPYLQFTWQLICAVLLM